MSQATRSIRNTLGATSLRGNDPILRLRPVDQPGSTSAAAPAWRALVQGKGDAPSQPSRSVPAVEDEDGYRIVGSAKSRTGAVQPSPSLAEHRTSRYNHRAPSALNPPSAAAVSRAAPYTPYQRPSGYSRSALPDPEYDFIQRRRADNRSFRYRKDEYTPGMIIRAPLHEQDSKGGQHRNGTGSSVATMASEATQAEKYTTESRFGTIFTKYRKMIVVALHQDNYVAVPLYTHNGNGLVNKAQPDEFVSVKDHRDKNDAHWKQLSKWQPLVTESLKDGIDLFDPKSTAHVAYPVSRRYALPVVLEGNLRNSSFKFLKELYGRYASAEGSLESREKGRERY
ncbi:MAG: hypothetical protein Q9218_004176 [Villophora microphyllina]